MANIQVTESFVTTKVFTQQEYAAHLLAKIDGIVAQLSSLKPSAFEDIDSYLEDVAGDMGKLIKKVKGAKCNITA